MANAQVLPGITKIDKNLIGHQALSLTNFADDVNLPAIAAGSKIEISGALFDVTADEAISGWSGIANSTQTYIMLTVSGAAFAASFTATAPVWSTAKQGWYDAASNNRYIGGCYKDSSGNYTKKFLYRASSGGVQNLREYGDGTIEVLGAISFVAGSIAGAALAAAGVSFAKLGISIGSVSVISLGANASFVLPAGVYFVWFSNPNYGGTQVGVSGTWTTVQINGMVVSDGANVRVSSLGIAVTAYSIRVM